MAKKVYELTAEKALKRLKANKGVTRADIGCQIDNVRVGNISYTHADGTPLTFGAKGVGEPKALVNLMLMGPVGQANAMEHIKNGDFGLATNETMVASVRPEEAKKLTPLFSRVDVIINEYYSKDEDCMKLGVESISGAKAGKEASTIDFTSAFEGLIDSVVATKKVAGVKESAGGGEE